MSRPGKMSGSAHAEIVKTPRLGRRWQGHWGRSRTTGHTCHTSTITRAPRVPACAPHRPPSCSACSCRWRVIALPVASLPHAAPHAGRAGVPVARRCAASQLDRGARRRRCGSSSRVVVPGPRTTLRPPARGAAPGRPEVLVTRTGVPSFDLLGVTWRAGTEPADLTVLVRTHGDAGWTRWTALDADADPGRPRGPHRPARHRAAVGRRRRRLPGAGRRPPRDRCRAGCGSTWSTRAARTPTTRSAPAGRCSRPQAAAGQPAIFTRAQWGADESIRGTAPSYNTTIRAGFVHHTAGANGYSAAEVPKILRGIYAYHVKGNGWSDIGYNFLVDRFGRLWEGRYGGIDRAVVGAHTGGFNVDSFAVSAIGNYDKVAAPPVMVDSIARLMAWKLSLSHRNPNGTTVAHLPGRRDVAVPRRPARSRFNVVSGHRDAGNTSCPGSNLYAQLADDPRADDDVPRHRPARPETRAGQCGLRQRREHHHGRRRDQRPAVEPRDPRGVPRHRGPHADRHGLAVGAGQRRLGPPGQRRCAGETRGLHGDPGQRATPRPRPAAGSARSPSRPRAPRRRSVRRPPCPGAPASCPSTRSASTTPAVDGNLPLGPGGRVDLRGARRRPGARRPGSRRSP